MADKFDPYREALVIETETVWPAECAAWPAAERGPAELRLHAEPQRATELNYIRQHTGFTRQIVVRPADLERLTAAS